MRKFAANYLISDAGVFLKNGIVVADNNGTALEFIDTTDDLKEIAQLIFYNGILISGVQFIKTDQKLVVTESPSPVGTFILKLTFGLKQITIQHFVELAKQVQEQFQEMKIPEIVGAITTVLIMNGGFSRENIPGIYLLKGVDLQKLQFKPDTILKMII
jgi:hypothetical protein